jgi:serine/threonine-protein kinase
MIPPIFDESCTSNLARTSPLAGGLHRWAGRKFSALLGRSSVHWTAEYRLIRRLGAGGQGVVCLADRLGSDGWKVPVALKFFSPDRYANRDAYLEDMACIATISSRAALIQQDHLLDVLNFVELEGIRVMTMEWIDGFDLDYLLALRTLDNLRTRVAASRWTYLNDVVVTSGPKKARLKPGVAVAIVRECLAALAALHRDGIVHGDVKPGNIMLKRTGNSKLIDLGSACEIGHVRSQRPLTPHYAAPEVLEGETPTPYSDLASLGYVLVEMLAGQPTFASVPNYRQLVEAKYRILDDLPQLLPQELLESDSLMRLVQTLVRPNPLERFPSAEAADLLEFGAASFQRELVTSDLASEYETEIRLWLEDLPPA